ALGLRLHLGDVHGDDLDAEDLLDRLADLRLVRVGMDAERVLPILDLVVALLGHDRSDQHLTGREAHSASSLPLSAATPARRWRVAGAPGAPRSGRPRRGAAPARPRGRPTATRGRFLNDFRIACSSPPATSTSGRCWPHASTRAAARLVEGSVQAAP